MTEPVAGPPWYRHRWFWLVAAPPIAAVVGGLLTVWIAVRNADSLVVDDYARIGRAFEMDQSRDRRARALGVGATLRLDRATGAFELAVHGVPAGELQIVLLHPVSDAGDRRLTVTADGDVDAGADAGDHYAGSFGPLDGARREVEIASAQQGWRLRGVLRPGGSELRLRAP
jgi:hypothetical protein